MNIPFDYEVSRRGTGAFKWEVLPPVAEGEPRYLPLSVADMDLAVPDVITRALAGVVNRKIYGYTTKDGGQGFDEALQSWLRRRFGLETETDSYIYANGSVELIKAAIFAFTNPGDGVVIQRPVYGHFTQAIEDECGRKAVSARLRLNEKGEYEMDFEALERCLAEPLNKIFVLCSPHNPVGRVWAEEDLRRVIELCEKYRVLLVSDEVHADLVRRGVKHLPILSLKPSWPLIIQIVAISKTFNCAGIQCANAIIPDARLRAQFEKALGPRMITPFAVAAQAAAYTAEGEAWLEELIDYLDETLRQVIGLFAAELPEVKVNYPEGTYILWFDFGPLGLEDDEIHHLIYDEARVILQDGLHHDPEGGSCFQRMCVASPRPMVMEAAERVIKVLKNRLGRA